MLSILLIIYENCIAVAHRQVLAHVIWVGLHGMWLSEKRATGETRTPDLVITNHALYQLSYCGAARPPGDWR